MTEIVNLTVSPGFTVVAWPAANFLVKAKSKICRIGTTSKSWSSSSPPFLPSPVVISLAAVAVVSPFWFPSVASGVESMSSTGLPVQSFASEISAAFLILVP